jgi:hypothetical protein
MIGTSGAVGPEAIVRIGGENQSSAISGVSVEDITAITPAQLVMIDAVGGNISRCRVNDIVYNGFAGTAPQNCMTIRSAEGTEHNVSDILVDGIIDQYSTNGVRLEQKSSGVMQDISFDSVTISGSSGRGFEFVQSAGTLREVRVGNGVNVLERATPFYYEGAVNQILIAPLAQPNALPAMCYDLGNIADDGVASVDLYRQIFGSIVMVATNYGEVGTFACRVANDTRWMYPQIASPELATSTATLTGTTGTDGKITVSAAEGKLMVENRIGAARSIQLIFLCGIQ